ncbi:MAG TPA: hypothetical protein VK177_17925 [Flavobacteriales bacterium]|nr:hypothetical protein [Flavobacteriales bacterium]
MKTKTTKTTFGQVRKKALAYWLKETNRKLHVNDVVRHSFECHWQNNYTSEDCHNSLYCSYGESNTLITDWLRDDRFDDYTFKTPKYNSRLYRHYVIFFLIVSEILVDFVDLHKLLDNPDTKKTRKALSIQGHQFDVHSLFCFINSICKHKMGDAEDMKHYHCLNHHIQYAFNDDEKPVKATINVNNLTTINISDLTGEEMLEVPTVMSIIEQLVHCYKYTSDFLYNNYKNVSDKLKPFEKGVKSPEMEPELINE